MSVSNETSLMNIMQWDVLLCLIVKINLSKKQNIFIIQTLSLSLEVFPIYATSPDAQPYEQHSQTKVSPQKASPFGHNIRKTPKIHPQLVPSSWIRYRAFPLLQPHGLCTGAFRVPSLSLLPFAHWLEHTPTH